MSESDDEIPTLSYWPSVTDLFLTLFIIAIAIVAVVFFALLPTNNVGKDRALVHAVGNDLLHVREPLNRLRVALELEPVNSAVRASEVIFALSETCDIAVKRIKEIEERLSRLTASKSLQDELELLLNEKEKLKNRLDEVQEQLARLVQAIGSDPDGIEKILQDNQNLRRQLHDKPPIIQVSEQKEEYRFESGSSKMGPAFIEGLFKHEFARLADEIVNRQEEGRVKVDTLEIIGHTDGVPLTRGGNLDVKLPAVLGGAQTDISSLVPGSNNDLGLLRALAVREQWLRFVESHEQAEALRAIHVRCYSAGQTIPPTPVVDVDASLFKNADARARRIEMRLTGLNN